MPRTALALYGIFVLVALGLRAALQRWQTGSSGIRVGAGTPLARTAAALFVASSCLVGLGAPLAQLSDVAAPIAALDSCYALGLACFAIGLPACLASQLWMGSSWRVGVDPGERTALVTSGPFRLVRNPIYTATALATVGLAMLVPNTIAVAGIALFSVALALQARAIEEPHLLSVHADAYARYAARTGRFLPRLGRLADAPPAEPPRGDRWHALDALRAMAMLWVIVGHAFLAYMDTRYGRLWAVYDASPSALLSVLFWWIHGFRLPLFFFLSGLFAARLLQSRGPDAYLRHRSKRILAPFALAAVVLLPVTFYVFALGWWLAGECTWNEIRRVRFAPRIQADIYGPVHLWFLEYLYLYSLAYWAYGRLRGAGVKAAPAWVERVLGSVWRPLACAIPTAIVLLVDPGVVTTHRNTFVPVPLELAYYGIFFATGASFFGLRDNLQQLARGGVACLALSLPLFWFATYPLVRQHLAAPSPAGDTALALSLALFAWLSVFGFIGVFQSWLARPNARLAYLADAAYWIYLVHLPLVAALQIAFATLDVAAEIKCVAVVALTLGACLWSYERWVRYTFIGALLNGRRVRPADAGTPRLPYVADGVRAGGNL